MVEGWAYEGAPQIGAASGTVTLLEGVTFCLAGTGGDIESGREHGLFYRDTRFLSRWVLEVDGAPVSPLGHHTLTPYSVSFVGRRPPAPHLADSTLVVTRRRHVGNGMVEEIGVRNHGREAAAVDLRLVLDSDFAGLFEVKEGRVQPRPNIRSQAGGSVVWLQHEAGADSRGVRVEGDGEARASGQELRWSLVVGPHETRTVTVRVTVSINGVDVVPRFVPGAALEESQPATRLAAWRDAAPVVTSADERLEPLLVQSLASLGALRIFHPTDPERTVVAAGAPWFMTLFGRDSILTSWMMLPVDPGLALGTALTLAELQGEREDPRSEEQPGRILHEVRSGPEAEFALGHGNIYYGSVDATPLFVLLVDELHRWGVDPARLSGLTPHVWRALDWLENYGDADGDGFVEYRRATTRGLRHQGWKDSFDAINFRSGEMAEPPIALAEVQGYAYAAYLAGARLADRVGDTWRAQRYRAKAEELKARFAEVFWLPEVGHLAAALDAAKRPVDALVSNLGHCLWTGIVADEHAEETAKALVSPPLFSGFGVRTLAAGMGAFNPVSYHNGSVWPHDSAIVAAGLMRYGFVDAAHRVIDGLLAASDCFAGALPELFCGFDRADFDPPVGYPTSCYPQAWAAAAPLLVLRTLLRLDPDVPAGTVRCDPAVPPHLAPLRVAGFVVAGTPVTVEVDTDTWTLTGLSPEIQLVQTN
ncbi:glycogen debranching N-terminal domain-containing protein [Sporichthya brevicatena]|uniref:Glycogen debranching N-terminal domain-containing protein n=1 Tax=Sporichthya brevicatena TaxID=171442 RepID=A0ABN1GCK3_9ACTN